MKTHRTPAAVTGQSLVTGHWSLGIPSLVRRPALVFVLLLLFGATLAPAQTVPLFINYQGKVTDSAGVGLGTPTPLNRKVIFRIYDAATAGNLLWTEEQTVTLSAGEFSVLLGQGIVFAAEARPALDTVFTSSGTGRFLQITVDNGDGTINGSDAPITPRQQITSTAYSFRARSADTIATGTDLTLNGSANYGLGWYGSGRTFGGTAIDGPVLYGFAGGALGSYNGTTQTTALRWNASSQVGIGSATLSGIDATSKLLLQGDDGTSPPKHLAIRGNTDNNKRLYLGYNTTNNYGALQAYNGVSTATNLLLNEIGGNVGIGMATAPAAKLDVNGAINGNSTITGSTLVTSGTNGLVFNGGGDGDGGLFSPADGVVTLKTNGTERLRADASGNVGIGVSPAERLHVSGGNMRLQSSGSPVAYNLVDSGGTARGVLGLPTAGGNYSSDSAANDFVIRADTGKLLLQSGSAASAICVIPGNNVGFGTNAPADRLHLKGTLRLESTSSTNHFQVYVDSFNSLLFKCNLNGGQYAYLNSNTFGLISTSDRRIKKDIEPMKDCLSRLMKLTPSTFRYKQAAPGSALNYGFIAQDVEQQFPDLVEEKEGLKRLASAGFEGINARAIQELKREKDAEVKALKDENADLKNKLAAQERRVAGLEAKEKQRDAKLAAIEKLLEEAGAPAARTVSLKKATAAK